jgi:alpha-glucosidase
MARKNLLPPGAAGKNNVMEVKRERARMKKVNLILLAGLAGSSLLAAPVVVQSPDGKISASFDVTDGSLFYSVSRGNTPVVASSKVELVEGAKMAVVDSSIRENDTSWKPVWGQFSTIRDHHRELTLSLTADGMPMTLLCRAFDTGVGFRFVLSEESNGKKITFSSQYKPLDGATDYSGQRGTKIPNVEKAKRIEVPLVTERQDGLHVAFLESDLYSAAPFELMRVSYSAADQSLVATSSAVSSGAGQVTAWRTILIGESAGDLVVNRVALNLAAPCKLADTSWIKPGKGLWDWRVHGYDNGDFVYGIDTRSYLRYIDFCSAQGLEYFTVDDMWFTKADNGAMDISPKVDIEKVMSYANEKGVKIMLYYDTRKGSYGDDKIFSYYAGLGAAGMKYGFRGNRADFTRMAMDSAAEHKLLVNFHDGPTPMAGVERTLPNLISREYCHGQQDSRSAFTPETFLRMATVSALTGPLDMSNGNFGLKSINAGEREKGPKKLNSYISTVVSEVARCLVIYTGLVTLPDAPEEYAKKADLFEFLKVMPSTWDDTLVPNSKIGDYITMARRSGEVWFVGSVNNEQARTLDIALDFLEPGKTYEATLYQDTSATHGVTNSEAYEIKTASVQRGDVIPAVMADGGGHAMILRPKK